MKLGAAVEAQSNSRTMSEWQIKKKESRRKGIQIRRRAFFKIEAHKIVVTADFLFVVAIFSLIWQNSESCKLLQLEIHFKVKHSESERKLNV